MGRWTRNYTNMLASMFAGPNVTSANSGGQAQYTNDNLTVRSMNGSYYKIVNDTSSIYGFQRPTCLMAGMPNVLNLVTTATSSSLPLGRLGVAIGNGSNSGDLYETYNLASIITTGIGMGTTTPPITVTYDGVNHKYTKTFGIGIQNTSNSNISISEIAITACLTSSSTQSSTNGYPTVIYYDTFEPITLEPYESVVITITQSFPLINYQPYPTE